MSQELALCGRKPDPTAAAGYQATLPPNGSIALSRELINHHLISNALERRRSITGLSLFDVCGFSITGPVAHISAASADCRRLFRTSISGRTSALRQRLPLLLSQFMARMRSPVGVLGCRLSELEREQPAFRIALIDPKRTCRRCRLFRKR